ncbi:hypothetical protein EVAR_60349_1 [Eumeta japonica]|uniref:Uncharacterized protein n=1 Tax=Eumeta variegata TaxID=151549 RepID=A0A4C1ZQ68_EUMVA|nr:hypothetical protein EVAR_60349_1 [Eumeta japonica]
MDEETQTLLTQWKMDDYIELFKEKPESNQSGVAVENAKEFSDVSDFILNINNKTCLWETTRLLPQQKKRVQKVWSNKQKVIIIVNSSTLTYYLESVSSDNALFEFEDSSDLLQWLENCTDPWDTVESHWIRTAGTRLKLVKNTNAPASVYINKYPALKTNSTKVGCSGPPSPPTPGADECHYELASRYLAGLLFWSRTARAAALRPGRGRGRRSARELSKLNSVGLDSFAADKHKDLANTN